MDGRVAQLRQDVESGRIPGEFDARIEQRISGKSGGGRGEKVSPDFRDANAA